MFVLVLLTALPFVWFGMIAAISFVETPLKFRAPGMTHALGVGIGRLVFRALNLIEALWAVIIVIAWMIRPELVSTPALMLLCASMAALALQMLILRPAMGQRTKALSHTALTHTGAAAVQGKVSTLTHLCYIGSELLKTIALPWAGVLILLEAAA